LTAERRLDKGPPWLNSRAPVADQLQRLEALGLNFNPADLPEVARQPWYVDDYRHSLPPEPPGEPIPGGPFETAKRLLRDYEFADPTRIRAYYRAEAPLRGRTMLLEIRYGVLRVRVGVRVGAVFDELREIEGERVRVWGWAYRTLGGHLERGQMDYQLWKWLRTGAVEFHIHAVSQRAEIRNPILAFGFRLVGRREQVRFARNCAARMERLVVARSSRGHAEPGPTDAGGILMSPSFR
jgi:uncharacterized protein (UPF0548 family)